MRAGVEEAVATGFTVKYVTAVANLLRNRNVTQSLWRGVTGKDITSVRLR